MKEWKAKIKKWKHEHEWAFKLILFFTFLIGLVVLIVSFYASGFDFFGWLFGPRGGFVAVLLFCVLLLFGSWAVYKPKKEDR